MKNNPAQETVGFAHCFGQIPCAAPLYLSERDDGIEREADRAASAMQSARSGEKISLAGMSESAGRRIVPTPIAGRLSRSTLGGDPLAAVDREAFESQLGRDLSAVRVHSDLRSAEDSETLRARAFTHESNIYFAAGEFRPDTCQGRWLLAHEIVHTLQDHSGLVACFADGVVIPAPSQDAAGEEIESALRIDPGDASGRVTESLSRLSPPRRRAVVSKLRARGLPLGWEDGLGRALEALGKTEPQVETGSSTEIMRQPSRTTQGAPEVESKSGGEQNAGTKSRLQDKTENAPLPIRTAPSTRSPAPTGRTPNASALSAPADASTHTTASAGAPASTTSVPVQDPANAAGSAPGAAAQQATTSGPADNGPLRLADLFAPTTASENAPPPAPDGGAGAAVFATNSPASIATDEAAAETQFLPMEIGGPTASPGPASREEPTPATDVDRHARMEGFAAQLEGALADAQTSLKTDAETARNSVRQKAALARGGIRAEVGRTISEIRAGSVALLSDLDKAVLSARGEIAACLTTRQEEAAVAGANSTKNIRGLFSGHRDTVNTTVSDAIRDAQKLRTDKAAEAQKRNRADIRTAYIKGGRKMHSYPGTTRGAYIGGAAFDVAEGAAIEMRKQEPDIADAIEEVTAPLPEHFRTQGAQALEGFDTNLPEILRNVAGGIAQTGADLNRKAAGAYRQPDEMAAQTRTEIATLTSNALQQTSAFGPRLEGQLDHSLGQIVHALSAAPADVIQRMSPPVEEAIALLRNAEDPDVEAAAQLTDVLIGFLDETASGTGATMGQSGEAGAQHFQQIRAGARQAMQAQKKGCETLWQGTRTSLSSTLPAMAKSVDAGFGGTLKLLGEALGETEKSIGEQLAPAVTGLKGGFRDNLRDAEGQIDQRINDGLSKNTDALNDLDSKMEEAADDAEFEWDHPVLSALEFIAGIIVGIVKVLALVLVLLVVTLILAAVLGISALAAGFVLLAAVVGFAIGYGFAARLDAGQGVGEAFLGSVTDFGRAAPGMLYDMTGIPKLKRAFSDEHMSRYERGKLIGEGGTEFVLAIFMVRGAAKGIAGKFRSLPKMPPPTGRLPAALPEPARIGFGREPLPRSGPSETPRIGFGREPAPTTSPRPEPTIGFGREPAPRIEPGAEPRIGFGRTPAPRTEPAPEPTIGFGREPSPRAEPRPEPTIGFGREPRPAPGPRHEPRIGFGRKPLPRPTVAPEATPGNVTNTRGQIIESPTTPKSGSNGTSHAGNFEGIARPGGRSPIEIRASAEPGAGGAQGPGTGEAAPRVGSIRSQSGSTSPVGEEAGAAAESDMPSGGYRPKPGERSMTREQYRAQQRQERIKSPEGLARRGRKPAPGQRSTTREEWRAQARSERVQKGIERDVEEAFAQERLDVPRQTGGRSDPRIEGRKIPGEPPRRMDIDDPTHGNVRLPRNPGETGRQAVARVRQLIGRKLSDFPDLERLWNLARERVLRNRTLDESNYEDLYDSSRDAFWRRVRRDPNALRRLEEAGFEPPAPGGRSPRLRNLDPSIPREEGTISLDHEVEKAIGENWRRALDADNLRMEFSRPNTNRENIQMRHPSLRPAPAPGSANTPATPDLEPVPADTP